MTPASRFSPCAIADGAGVSVSRTLRIAVMCHRNAMPAKGTR
jgi:hypothetical protein